MKARMKRKTSCSTRQHCRRKRCDRKPNSLSSRNESERASSFGTRRVGSWPRVPLAPSTFRGVSEPS